MQIAGTNGAANQVVLSQSNNSGKGRSETTNNGLSFMSAVKQVAETISGKIVIANGSDISKQEFHKFKPEELFDEEEGIDTVYDFIADIRSILREKKQG